MVRKVPSIAKRAKKAATKWRSHFENNIKQYHEMTQFVLGEQWTDEEQDMLKTYKKIPLQFNKLATLRNTLVGEQLQNTPQLQVVPMENCDQEVAKLRELIVKEMMFCSGAKQAYQVAASQAFTGGFGAFAPLTDYVHEKSFDLDIYYVSFRDPTRCYWDVGAESINKTDGMHCGWLTRVSREKFRDTYGKTIEEKVYPDNKNDIAASRDEVAMATETGIGYDDYIWNDEEGVTIQHHFERKSVSETLYKLSNGHICTEAEMDEIRDASRKKNLEIAEEEQQQELQQLMQQMQQQRQQQPGMQQDPNMQQGAYDPLLGQQQTDQQTNPLLDQISALQNQQPQIDENRMVLWDDQEQVRIESKKESTRYEVKHYKICGEYVLDQSVFPSEQLPLVFVDQDSFYNKEAKQICRPFLIDAKDTQRYLNYLGTQSAYVLKVSRYDQWIGSKKNIQGQDTQQIWSDPSTQQGMLYFDESPNGIVPREVRPPELSQSLLTQYQRAIEDLYTCTGMYPTKLGQQGNEISGAAIDARTRQGSYSTFIAFNSINRAIAKGGEIVNEMIPHVYDSQRVISLMTPDEGMKNITINRQDDEYGERIENDIRKGSYQVRLMPGPSYEGQKEEALQSLNAALQANPQIFNMIADLYAENLPLANTIELKNRLKSLVPPQIIEAGKTGKSPPQQPQQQDPQALQAQMAMQQAQMQAQLKSKELQIKSAELELKQQKQTQEVQLEMAKLESERQALQAEMQKQRLEFMAENNRSNVDLQLGHADNLAKILTHKIG